MRRIAERTVTITVSAQISDVYKCIRNLLFDSLRNSLVSSNLSYIVAYFFSIVGYVLLRFYVLRGVAPDGFSHQSCGKN